MKRKLLSFLMVVILVCAMCGVVQGEGIGVFIDGEALVMDVAPVIITGRTMVPVRGIFERLGAEVEWSGETETVTAVKGGTVINLVTGSGTAFVNSRPTALDAPPVKLGDRVLVPLRFVSESFEAKVEWIPDELKVEITTSDATADGGAADGGATDNGATDGGATDGGNDGGNDGAAAYDGPVYEGTDIPDITALAADKKLVTIMKDTKMGVVAYFYEYNKDKDADLIRRYNTLLGKLGYEEREGVLTLGGISVYASVSLDGTEMSVTLKSQQYIGGAALPGFEPIIFGEKVFPSFGNACGYEPHFVYIVPGRYMSLSYDSTLFDDDAAVEAYKRIIEAEGYTYRDDWGGRDSYDGDGTSIGIQRNYDQVTINVSYYIY